MSSLLTALAWHPGFLWPWYTDAVVAESTAAAVAEPTVAVVAEPIAAVVALGFPPLTLIWKLPMW